MRPDAATGHLLQVLHNLAVVEHYSSKRQDSKRLLEQLTHLLNVRCEGAHRLAVNHGSRRINSVPAL